MFPDPSARDVDELRFVANIRYMTLSQLRED